MLAFGLLAWVVCASWDPVGGRGLKFAYDTHVTRGVPVRYGDFTAAVAVCLVAVTTTFVRWFVLLRTLDLPVRFADVVRLGAVGLFYNTFLPGAVGGDVVKGVILARWQTRRATAVATILADRVIGLWSLVGVAAVAGAAFWATGQPTGAAGPLARWVALTAGAITAAGVLGWVGLGLCPVWAERFGTRVRRVPRIGAAGADLWQAVLLYRRQPWGVFAAVLLAVAGHLMFVGAFFLGAGTLVTSDGPGRGIPSPAEYLLIVPAGLLIRAIPLFPGGAGIGELGLAELYQQFGYPAAAGVLASLVYRAVFWVLGLTGYFVYAQMGTVRAPAGPPDGHRPPDRGVEGRDGGLVRGEHVNGDVSRPPPSA